MGNILVWYKRLSPCRALEFSRAIAWTVIPLTLAFSFMLDGKSTPLAKELVDAGLGAATHKSIWMKQMSFSPPSVAGGFHLI